MANNPCYGLIDHTINYFYPGSVASLKYAEEAKRKLEKRIPGHVFTIVKYNKETNKWEKV